MGWHILLLVCASTVSRPACQPDTALDVIEGPSVPSELLCGLHGQAYLAETAIGRDLKAGSYVKVLCWRPSSADRRNARHIQPFGE